MPLVIALVLLTIGSVVFHLWSPWWLTPIASHWDTIDATIDITFWVTGVVFVAVNLFMAYAIVRYRYDKNKRAAYEPENKKLELWLTGITTVCARLRNHSRFHRNAPICGAAPSPVATA